MRAVRLLALLQFLAICSATACKYDTDCAVRQAGMAARCDAGECFVHRCISPAQNLTGKVLYVGDSISLGMLSAAGPAAARVVHAPNKSRYHTNNSRNSVLVSQCITTWLTADNPPECVLINFGLHDIKNDTCHVPLGEYRRRSTAVFAHATSVTGCVRWVSSTPVPDCDPKRPGGNAEIRKYNLVAAEEAMRAGAGVIDLHAFVGNNSTMRARETSGHNAVAPPAG